jgi:hypothetical protein
MTSKDFFKVKAMKSLLKNQDFIIIRRENLAGGGGACVTLCPRDGHSDVALLCTKGEYRFTLSGHFAGCFFEKELAFADFRPYDIEVAISEGYVERSYVEDWDALQRALGREENLISAAKP